MKKRGPPRQNLTPDAIKPMCKSARDWSIWGALIHQWMFIPCEQIHVTSKFMLQSSKRARIAHHQARFLPLLKNFFSFYRQNSSTTVRVASLFSFPDQMSTLTGCKPGRTAPADIAQSKAYTSKRDSWRHVPVVWFRMPQRIGTPFLGYHWHTKRRAAAPGPAPLPRREALLYNNQVPVVSPHCRNNRTTQVSEESRFSLSLILELSLLRHHCEVEVADNYQHNESLSHIVSCLLGAW